MKQFIQGTPEAFADLQRRLGHSTLVFNDCEFPPGSTPARGRVAFEARPDNRYALLVDLGTRYPGADAIRPLFSDGERVFPNFESLVGFFKGPLNDVFASTNRLSPEDITNLDAVTDAMAARRQAVTDIHPDAIRERIEASIYGQESAVRTIADLAARHISRLEPNRPATVFLLGPTGVGKTSACQALADALDDTGYQFLRLDMAEYQEAYRVSQLLGSPQGYVGHNEGSQFIRHLARHPKSIILFDEIEKAHPDVFRMLMNLMDAGRITSPTSIDGKYEIDARNAILAFTSNLGAERLLAETHRLDRDAGEDAIDELCRRHLIEQRIPRELVGRIQAFALFQPLEARHRAAAMVGAIERIGRAYGVTVREVAPEVVADLIARGDQRFGVRQDEYLIERTLARLFIDAYRDGLRQTAILHDPIRVVAASQEDEPVALAA